LAFGLNFNSFLALDMAESLKNLFALATNCRAVRLAALTALRAFGGPEPFGLSSADLSSADLSQRACFPLTYLQPASLRLAPLRLTYLGQPISWPANSAILLRQSREPPPEKEVGSD
jgi:hypothetical protein